MRKVPIDVEVVATPPTALSGPAGSMLTDTTRPATVAGTVVIGLAPVEGPAGLPLSPPHAATAAAAASDAMRQASRQNSRRVTGRTNSCELIEPPSLPFRA